MALVPYHTHTFILPTASQDEAETGSSEDVVMTPLATEQKVASVIGTRVQPQSANLSSLAAVTPGAAGKAVLGSSTSAAVRNTISPVNGFNANGSTSDTSNFTALEALSSGQVVDLSGLTYAVSAIPSGNRYRNGFFKIGATTYDANEVDSLISSATDTGGIETAYTGGVNNTPTVSGRSNLKLNALFASQNSRSSYRPRNVVIASIYSWITSLVGAMVATRQSYATMPQSFIAGTEECWIDTGSRNTVVGSIFSTGEGTSTFTGGSRSSRSSGWESAVVGSNGCVAGAGSGARFLVNVNGSGVVTSVTILDGGTDYIDPTVEITDRVGTGAGATATVTVTNGVVTAVNLLTGGSGYSQDANAVNFALFSRRSMVVAGSAGSSARGYQSFIGGSGNADATGNQSVVLGSNRSTASGTNSAVVASGITAGGTGKIDCIASGDNSMVAASGSATATGQYSMALAAAICSTTGTRSLVSGRRVLNTVQDSWAGGSVGSGSATTANRSMHIYYGTGSIEIAGVLTQNKVFTDIAKMFENVMPGKEIPVGALVSLEGRKVRLAKPGDAFFSVHTRTYVQLLGDTGFTWAGRYLHDDHGEILMQQVPDPDWVAEIPDPKWPVQVVNPAHPVVEDLVDEKGDPVLDKDDNPIRYIVSSPVMDNPVPAPMIPNPSPQPMMTAQIENPEYDPTMEQTPRSQRRDEWTPILLQGEAFMHVTADVAPGDYIMPVSPGIGGKATAPTSFLCMEIMTPFNAKKGYAIALGLRV